MTQNAPNPPFQPGRRGYGGDGISPKKMILGLILAASIVVFFLILFVGILAVIQEGSLREGRHVPLIGMARHAITHVLRLLHHH